MTGTAPLRVLTAGMHGSASTWVFNVAREVLEAARGAGAVESCHVIQPDDLTRLCAQGSRDVVAKTHGWPGLAEAAQACGARVIVSIRDPRDAMVSVQERFGEPFDRCLRGVLQDCRAAHGCAEAGYPVLRYEDRFFERPETVGMVAEALGLAVPQATAARIFAAYTTDAVRAFAATVTALPAERVMGGGNLVFDRLTQITHTHIGDTRTGKWRERLDPGQQAMANMLFRPFLARFGYAAG